MTSLLRLLTLCALLWPVCLRAQDANDAVTLIADQVFLSGNNGLVAEGHVEAIYGDVRLTATRITYDRAADRIAVEGPIRLHDGADVVIVASLGELDADLQNGLLHSARMVLNQQVQLAANQLARVDGRYSQLVRASVTSCRVCDNGRPPLWQIRARRVIHDQQDRQLYFHDAQLLIGNAPVVVLPRLRLPDPTLKRSRGFLIPSLKSNTQLGVGMKLPYFVPIGASKDITLTPFLSPHTRTLEWRYRQAFRRGTITFDGALSNDDLLAGSGMRGYVFGTGHFDLARDFTLDFDLKATSDDAYLLDYDYSSLDRLDSHATLARTSRDETMQLTFRHYQSLRDGENNSTLPTLVANADFERRYFPTLIGGEARLRLGAHGHYRTSDRDTDGPDLDSIVDGRDVYRGHAALGWRRGWTLGGGMRAALATDLTLDAVRTEQDVTSERSVAYATPSVQAELRWPLLRHAASGATQVLEPVAMIGWVGGSTPAIANDESTRVEFDEGNLLSLSRFPAEDRREHGAQAAIGVNWTRLDPAGWQAALSLGQVWHEQRQADFSKTSGLSERMSDVLIAGQLKFPNGLALTARGLLDMGSGVHKAEARASWTTPKLGFEAAYVWLGPDPDEDRVATLSEWSLDGRYRVSRHWTAVTNWRYDVARDSTARAGIGLQYRNECVKIDFSVSRRFTSSTSVQPSTDIGFTVALLGFTARTQDKSYARTCRTNAG